MKQTKKAVLLATLFCVSLTGVKAQEAEQTGSPTLDVDLQKAIEIAVAENPTIRIADKDIELKKIADKEAWQSLLPSVQADLSLSHSIKVAAIKTAMGEFKMGSDGTTTAMGGISMSLPIYAPAVYQNMKLTKEDILLAQEKARSSRLSLINQVKKAYYSVLLAKDSRDVMERSYKVTKDNFDVVNKKFEAGRVSEYDKISAEVQMRNIKSSVVSAETGLTLATLQLKVLMGINTDINVNVTDSLRGHEAEITLANAEAPAAELENNSSLRQLDMNRNLLLQAQKILKTNFLPTVGMQLSYQYNSYSNDSWNVFSYKYSPSSTFALAISIPIYKASNWTKLQSNRMQLSQLADTRENTARQLSMAAESYRKNMITSIAKLESDREAVRQADKAVTISSKRYDVGRGTILDFNQSEIALITAELTYNQGIFDYLSNKADLDYTLGRE